MIRARSFKAVDPSTLVMLMRGVWELEPPASAVRKAFIEWVRGHLHPDGLHILQSRRDITEPPARHARVEHVHGQGG